MGTSLSLRERSPEGRVRVRKYDAKFSNPHPALRADLSQRERGAALYTKVFRK
jgi:hypothetical protein